MIEPSLFEISAAVIGVAAVFGYINHCFFKLPATIGLVVIALITSLGIMALDATLPTYAIGDVVRGFVTGIDFHETLMKGMLAFLLFAGALHVDLGTLLERKWSIGLMATIGVVIATTLVALAIYVVSGLLGFEIAFIHCLLFGALIAPTDPVAVLGILKTTKVPDTLKAKIAGESLFNDGVGVVVFTILLAFAGFGSGHGDATGGGHGMAAAEIAELFALEVFGGAALGFGLGYICYRAQKGIDEPVLEVIMTLALVMVAYTVALALHMSGPIAVVVAGLLIGNTGVAHAMTERSKEHVETFWLLIDEILNAALFLIIGFEILALTVTPELAVLALLAIPLVLAARFIGVGLPLTILKLRESFTPGAIRVLTWGGLRGGISVALVLSLPAFPAKDTLVTMTYAVVVFSIVVQGLTVGPLVRKLVR